MTAINLTDAANKLVGDFTRQRGNGEGALATVRDAIALVRLHNDTTVLARMMQRAETKGDTHAFKALQLIVGKVWPGAKTGKDANGFRVVKIAKCAVSNSAVAILDKCVEDKLSIRGTTYRKRFQPDAADEPKAVEPVKWAERQAKLHADPALLRAMATALLEQAKKLPPVAAPVQGEPAH